MTNKKIEPTKENSRILAEYLAAQVSLARKKKYGLDQKSYFSFEMPSAQDLLETCDDAYDDKELEGGITNGNSKK